MNTTEAEAEAPTEWEAPTSWALTPEEFDATAKRIEQINARAARRGFTGRLQLTGTPREITENDEAGLPRTRTVVDTTITGEAPAYNGWRFLAAVDSIDTADGPDFILRTAPGIEDSGVDRSTLVPGRCQHCNTTRANRTHTYLVRHDETGQTVQVGSSCIKDFTGWTGRPVFIRTDELARQVDDFLGGRGASRPEYTPETVIAAAWAISRDSGWVPASAAAPGRTATKELVSSYLYGASTADREYRRQIAPHVTDATATARTIITDLLAGLHDSSDYVTNLHTLLRAEHVNSRHLGMVVSAVGAYERMTGETARKTAAAADRAAARAAIDYAGTVREKLTVTGTVTRLVPFQSSYGYHRATNMLVIVENPTTAAKIATAARWAWTIKQGDQVTLTGTVKAHEDYQGTKQTVLTRAKLDDHRPAVPREPDTRAEADG